MKTTETKARAGEVVSGAPAEEVRHALAGFLSEFKGFQDEMTSKLQQQEERLTMLDRKSFTAGRPALSTAVDLDVPHKKAFSAYLRSGDDDGLRGLVLEGKALNTQVNADGGFLVDPETSDRIRGVLKATSSLRSISNVVNVEATSFDVLVDHTDLGSGWATETAALAETGTPQIDRISIPLHELAAMPKASQRLLDDSAFDVEGWLAERIADRFARAEAQAFVAGDGVDKPKGFLTHTTVDNGVWAWGSLGYVPTGAAGDFAATNASDSIIDLVYALNAEYRANATFVMNSKTAGAVRKMKDADGRFLWSDGLAAGEPARLMGYQVLIAEDMPDIGANAYAIAFGDFRSGYTVAERPDMRVLRDPFSAKPHVLFYASKRVGGDVSDFAAIKLLKFAIS
ncbi:MAG: phage major capsid protein [Rhodobacteraceae bacterium]|jgi:HK97 family phage major capsid protein|uniref:phage major capsid protein n=1 Tax=Albidovulum sp. TaxID=1872424 RepID=UPI00265A3D38|nr:phage major capsid protein [uncultured Defluviimonas sp.]MCC0070332.1 phage major capsid protein [Paracoccaceae bacterium]